MLFPTEEGFDPFDVVVLLHQSLKISKALKDSRVCCLFGLTEPNLLSVPNLHVVVDDLQLLILHLFLLLLHSVQRNLLITVVCDVVLAPLQLLVQHPAVKQEVRAIAQFLPVERQCNHRVDKLLDFLLNCIIVVPQLECAVRFESEHGAIAELVFEPVLLDLPADVVEIGH